MTGRVPPSCRAGPQHRAQGTAGLTLSDLGAAGLQMHPDAHGGLQTILGLRDLLVEPQTAPPSDGPCPWEGEAGGSTRSEGCAPDGGTTADRLGLFGGELTASRMCGISASFLRVAAASGGSRRTLS